MWERKGAEGEWTHLVYNVSVKVWNQSFHLCTGTLMHTVTSVHSCFLYVDLSSGHVRKVNLNFSSVFGFLAECFCDVAGPHRVFFRERCTCYGHSAHHHPLNSYVEGQCPMSQDVTVFGDGIFTVVIKLKWDAQVGPESNRTDVLMRRDSETDTQREEHVGRRENPSTSQGRNQSYLHFNLWLLASRIGRTQICVV